VSGIENRPARAAAAAPERYPMLDSLRAIAALLVFAAHIALYLAVAGYDFAPFLQRIDVPVAIFMLLSSFLLYRPMVRTRWRRDRAPSTWTFAVRRFFRIVPVYYVILIATAVFFSMDYVFTAKGVLTYFGFLQVYDGGTITNGIGQAWTLDIEIAFYVFLPIWAFGIRRLRWTSTRGFVLSELAPLALIAVFGIAWKTIVFATSTAGPGLGVPKLSPGLYTLPAYLDVFAIGCALAVASVVLEGRDPQPRIVREIRARPWLPWLLAFGFYWLAGVAGDSSNTQPALDYTLHQAANAAVAALLFLPAVFAPRDRSLFTRVIANRPMIWMASISYGFYLWHLPVVTAIARHQLFDIDVADQPVLFALSGFAVTTALSALTYYLIGKPAIEYSHRVPRDLPARALARLRGSRAVADVAPAPAGGGTEPVAPEVSGARSAADPRPGG